MSDNSTNRRAAVITALSKEKDAMEEFLSDVESEKGPHNTIYRRGNLSVDEGRWEILLREAGKGQSNVAAEIERIGHHFDPEVILFVGIAGGLKDTELGDVVFATTVKGYEYGSIEQRIKETEDDDSYEEVRRSRAQVSSPTYAAKEIAKDAKNEEWHQRCLIECGTEPQVLGEPIASGSKVVKTDDLRSATYQVLSEDFSECVAVEMEGFGFQNAIYKSNMHGIVIRGISDLLSNKKQTEQEGLQERASAHAAAFSVEILNHILQLYPEQFPEDTPTQKIKESLTSEKEKIEGESPEQFLDALSNLEPDDISIEKAISAIYDKKKK